MRPRTTTFIAAALLCSMVAGAPGQEQQRQQPVFRSAVSRVRVDVVVTGDDGAFVDDLAADDFRVFEDGRPVEVLDVQLVDLGAGRVDTLPRPGDAAGRAGAPGPAEDPAGPEDTSFPAAPRSDPVADLGGMVYVIDGPSLTPQTRARFTDAWAEVLERTSSLAVPKAVYFVDNSGRLRELTPMTRDAARLRDAADEVAAEPLTTSDRRARMVELARDLSGGAPSDPGGGGGGGGGGGAAGGGLFEDPGPRVAAQKARQFEAEEKDRSIAAYRLLSAVCDALWARPGRTALVWVSSGIKLMQGGPYTALLEAAETGNSTGNLPRENVSPDPRILEAQEALHRAANSANVSIYSVDPALINETRSLGYDVSVQSSPGATMLQSAIVLQSLDALDDALLQASEATGGKAFLHASEVGEVLGEIDEHSSRFYLLTYRPPPPDGDGEYHDIRVEVDREDVDVQARRGYVDTPAEERARRSVNAALQLTGTATGLPVEASIYTSWREERAVVLLAVSVDPARVGVYVDGDGRRMSSVEFHTIVAEGDKVIDESHQGMRVERSAAAREPDPVPGGPGAPGPAAPGELVYRHEFELDADGDYELRVAVLDPVSERLGATRVQVPIPERPEGWHTSDAVLVLVEPSGAVRPVIGGRTRPGHDAAAYVEVYGGRRPILRGQVFTAGSTGDDAQHAELFATPLRRVGPGTHRGAISLPPTLPPGRYVVQLQVTDAPASEHRVLRLPFEVVGSRR